MTTRMEMEAHSYQRRQTEALETIAETLRAIAARAETPDATLARVPAPPRDPMDYFHGKDFAALSAHLAALVASGEARALRERAGYSQDELGTLFGVNGASVGYWENAQSRPSYRHAIAYYYLLLDLAEGTHKGTSIASGRWTGDGE